MLGAGCCDGWHHWSARGRTVRRLLRRRRGDSRGMEDTITLRSRGARYGATPRVSREEDFGRRESLLLRRTVTLFGVAVVAALAAIAFRETYANAVIMLRAAPDIATDPTPEPLAVPEAEINDVIPSSVKVSDDVPTAACACGSTVKETIALVFDSLPHDCTPLTSMDKTCLSSDACGALKSTVNNACPGVVS